MAYAVNARVKVTDQSSQWRGHFGTVLAVDGANHDVRLDGHGAEKTVLLLTPQLQTTTLVCPIDYP